MRRDMLFALHSLLAGALASYASDPGALQNILRNTDKSDRYQYPTDFTRGIIPKAFHSHNDYWRDVPFYSALSYGAMSVEADVWLINETLYVGHELSALTPERTLKSLYIDPILDTLHRQNPNTQFSPPNSRNGVYDADSGQTLYFFIDFKTGPQETWAAVLSALEPLQKDDWLSTYDGKDFQKRPVTVIGTGNTPLTSVQKSIPRHIFYDAPLAKLDSEFSNVTANDSPIASTNFDASFGQVRKQALDDKQLEKLREQIRGAHDKGIKVRYWNQPNWPIGTRNAVWRTLWEEGADLLNADDLEGCAEFWKTG